MANRPKKEAEPAAAERDGAEEAVGFDARLRRLEALVAELEDGKLDLEPAIARYKEGVALLRGCRDVLAGYRKQVEELVGDAGDETRAYEGDPDAGPARSGR